MPIELKIPAIGESITEVEIGDWLKPEGSPVRKDENVVTIESDKATVEIPSPADGKVSRVLKRKGEKAAIGEVIGMIEPGTVAEAKIEKSQESQTPPTKEKKAAKTEPFVMPAAEREHLTGARVLRGRGGDPGDEVVHVDRREDAATAVREREPPSADQPDRLDRPRRGARPVDVAGTDMFPMAGAARRADILRTNDLCVAGEQLAE